MATQQPNMDALNKAAKKRRTNQPHANPDMNKRIASLHKRWQKLWLRSSERHRQLLEARTRMKDIALARSFNFDNWSNHDGMLTREEFMKGLKASGKIDSWEKKKKSSLLRPKKKALLLRLIMGVA